MNMKTVKAVEPCSTFRVLLSYILVLIQLLVPLGISIPLPVSAATQANSHSPFEVDRQTGISADTQNTALPYGSQMSSAASSLSSGGSDGPMNAARSAAAGYASDSVEGWLKQFGTARVQLNVDQDGNWDNSSIDFLAPLYDSKKAMLFTQLGFRAPDGRNTGNFGAGVRTFTGDWMYGANVFLDDDFTGQNRRVGIGAEAWTNYLKLSANSYVGTTNWHQSRDFDDYNEKPADGFDIRTEGYLPSYAFIGAKLMYEKYYGDQVALFDTDHLQNNPSAVTVGLNYTPVPLVTMAVDYKRGQDSLDDTQFSVNFRYSIGRPWSEQISPAQVDVERSLAGSRYDMVERNNTIVMAYQKKSLNEQLANMTLLISKDGSPADGATANQASVQATTGSGAAAKNTVINWTVNGTAKLSSSTSTTDDNGMAIVNFTNTAAGPVTVTASSGSISRQQASSFVQSVSDVSLNITQNDSMADGVAENAGQATVKDASGKPMAGVDITWSADNSAKITSSDAKTDANGQATARFSNTAVGNTTLKVSAGGKDASKVSAFVADAPAKLQVSMTTNNVVADGVTPAVAQAVVTDTSGKPMPNVSVTWSLSGSSTATAKSSTTVTTNSSGIATLNLADTVAEGVTVNANAGGKTGTTTATFTVVPVNGLTVSMTANNALADGASLNTAQAVVKNASDQPMPNVNVTWSLSGSSTAAAKSSATVATNASGIATLNLTDTVAEGVTVNAAAEGKTESTTATFIALPVSNVAASMTTDNSPADGTTQNVAKAVVTRADGQPMGGVSVTWALTSGGATATTPLTATTDNTGVATLQLTDTSPEGVNLTATAGGKTGQTVATFTAVPVNVVAVSMTTNNAPADGTTPNIATATVTNASGQGMKNVSVTWSLSGSSTAAMTSAITVVTNDSGIATLNLTDTVAEGITVNASASGKIGGTTATFTAVPVSNVAASMTTDNSPADGTTQNVAKAVVTRADGQPMGGVSVTWALTSGGATATTPLTATTDNTGVATLQLTDTSPEGVNLTATAGGKTGQTVATFTAVPVNAVAVSMTINYAPADGVTTNIATATATNATGQPMKNISLTWALTSGSATATTPLTVTTDSNGQATLSLTDVIGQSVDLTATAGGKTGNATATFTVLKAVKVTLTTDAARGSPLDPATNTALVTDSLGNPIAGVRLTWSGPGGFTTCSIQSSTNSQGVALQICTSPSGFSMNATSTVTVNPGDTQDPNATVSASVTRTYYPN